jgi:hypothetical protein
VEFVVMLLQPLSAKLRYLQEKVLLKCVQTYLEVSSLRKLLSTFIKFANKPCGSVMRSLMSVKISRLIKSLIALVALERPLTSVLTLMCLERSDLDTILGGEKSPTLKFPFWEKDLLQPG